MAVKTVGQTSLTCQTSYRAQQLVYCSCFLEQMVNMYSSKTISKRSNQNKIYDYLCGC